MASQQVVLETDRLFFRPYTPRDFPFFERLWTNPDVIQFVGTGRVKTESELKQVFPIWVSRSELGRGILLMCHKETGEAIGHAGLVPQIVEGTQEMEIGYWLDQPFWGMGYATEAALAFREYARRKLLYKRLVSIIQPGNERSIDVAKRIGMNFEREVNFHGKRPHLYVWKADVLKKR